MKLIYTKSPEETVDWAKALAKRLVGGEVIGLDGDLGAGKTVFVKGLAEGLGISRPILSPTFNIVREYDEGRLKLNHFDVYRIGDPEEMFEIGFSEYLVGRQVSVIEWSTLIEDWMPKDCLRIHIRYTEDGREIALDAPNEEWEAKIR